MSCSFTDDDVKRILSFIYKKTAKAYILQDQKKVVLEQESGKGISLGFTFFIQLIKDGLIERKKGNIISLTGKGESFACRLDLVENRFQSQHRDLINDVISVEEGSIFVSRNTNESPLTQLMRRKGKDGKPFLDGAEFRAGERLRRDYSRGQMMPKIGMNWQFPLPSTKNRRVSDYSESTESVIAARIRVEKAVRSVGPELSGVLIDICCFLKGLEVVEAERQWPVRSAKVVLKAALGSLARHYEPEVEKKENPIFHWGDSEYKPALSCYS